MMLLLAGCVGTDLVDEPVATMPARVAINPTNTAVEVGKTASFQASYYDSVGNQIADVAFQWISSDQNIANVPAGVTLTTYNWVIIHCVPFNVTFGYAQLQ
jgi:Electron transfer DM13